MNVSRRDQHDFPKRVVVGLGEVLWDVFPDGPRFGGAPANFACSAAGLGRSRVEVWLTSSVGDDDLGRQATKSLRRHGVHTSCVAVHDQPTGQVLIELDSAGCALYTFAADTAWDHLTWSTELQRLATRTDAVCFGTLAQRSADSRATIRRFVANTRASALRIFDINLRPPFVSECAVIESLELANVLKLNDEELTVVAGMLGLTGSQIAVMRQLAGRFSLRVVALTRGAKGAVLIRGAELSEHPGIPSDVVDTVGAGDAFTAALALGLLDDCDLGTINRTACEVAAFVCSQSGATPEMPDRFVNTIKTAAAMGV